MIRISILALLFLPIVSFCQTISSRLVNVDSGWAANSVNAVVFRKNALASWQGWQFIAYYANDASVMLAKRKLGDLKWEIQKTKFKGRVRDAHNSISIMTDGEGYLHLSWDHHNNPLHYARSLAPGSLEMGDAVPMIGGQEERVTYPEFYRLPNGNLIFMYRDGSSGNGNLVINGYNTKNRSWQRLHQQLIDGEGKRNAYWQACVDVKGRIHISWVWRENAGVETNHDMAYARSDDGGLTWKRSNGAQYTLPIQQSSAEYVARIPQGSELMNQTSMYATAGSEIFIASYWKRGNNGPEYQLISKKGRHWNVQTVVHRQNPFSLSNTVGTVAAPMSRPQVLAWKRGRHTAVAVVFCDEERGRKVSVAVNDNYKKANWRISDLTIQGYGSWEPSYDTELWKETKQLHLFLQKVEQINAEGLASAAAQMVAVLECRLAEPE